jgi:glycosyltransferase involved in cell wall biosynthesis
VVSSQRAFRDLSPGPYRHLLRLTDLLSDAVVVNCRALRRHLVEDYGVPEAKIRLCHNGIDTDQFRPAPRARPVELQGAAAVIGVVCALRPEKGLPTLLEAFARVRKATPGARLLIVGSGEMLPKLEALRTHLNLGDACLFKPATADVAAWLNVLDVFVLPSLSEAFSNSLMEAMACGCAVVASEAGGNPELVEDGRTGLLFKTGDPADLAAKLQRLLGQESLRRNLAETGRRFIHQGFSLASATRNMEGIYRELLAGKPRGS